MTGWKKYTTDDDNISEQSKISSDEKIHDGGMEEV